MRPKNISDDYAIDQDVIDNFIKFAKKNKYKLNYLCYLYPVNPLIKISTLKKCKKILRKSSCQSVITVHKYSFPVELALIKNSWGYIEVKNKKYNNYRSQYFSSSYVDAGQCYWYKMSSIKKFKNIKTKAIELKRFEYLDVDTEEDLKVLKKIYKYKLHKN